MTCHEPTKKRTIKTVAPEDSTQRAQGRAGQDQRCTGLGCRFPQIRFLTTQENFKQRAPGRARRTDQVSGAGAFAVVFRKHGLQEEQTRQAAREPRLRSPASSILTNSTSSLFEVFISGINGRSSLSTRFWSYRV